MYLHGTWFIGWAGASQEDFSEIAGFKLNPSPKRGSGVKALAKSVLELRSRIDELEEIEGGLQRLMVCLMLNGDVKRNFIVVD
jgi:hypothetical protein